MTTHREFGSTSVKRGLLVLVAAAGLAVTMAACGSDDKPTVASQPATGWPIGLPSQNQRRIWLSAIEEGSLLSDAICPSVSSRLR